MVALQVVRCLVNQIGGVAAQSPCAEMAHVLLGLRDS